MKGKGGGVSEMIHWKGGGGFRFYNLGEPVFGADGAIHPQVGFKPLAAYIWHFETGRPTAVDFTTPLLGVHEETAYYLMYNGVLGDRRPQGGNVLTTAVLNGLKAEFPHDGPKIIYGETTLLGTERLKAEGIEFKQIPYDICIR